MKQAKATDINKQIATVSSPDYSLIIARLEKAIIHGDDPQHCRDILAKESLWQKFDANEQLKWVSLAQMAGEMDIALQILAYQNRVSPENKDAWSERFDLLTILNRREELAVMLAEAKKHVEHNIWMSWRKLCNINIDTNNKKEADSEIISEPFVQMRQRQEQIETFLKLFAGKEDAFARQWVDKSENRQGYVPVRRPITTVDIEDHLNGNKTYGIYLLDSNAKVRTAVIDADIRSEFRKTKLKADQMRQFVREKTYMVSRIKELSLDIKMTPLIEFSGSKGYHFWYFFENPVSAESAKELLGKIKSSIADDLKSFSLEVFPKQSSLTGKGFGNLVKLPLGVHRINGKKSFFIECNSRKENDQLEFLMKVKPACTKDIKEQQAINKTQNIMLHPKLEEWAKQYPDLFELEKKCAPMAQIISLCKSGKDLSTREEKILFQTIGFIEKRKSSLHHLLSKSSEYNPLMVDFNLSRLRGTPLGCKRIHSLLNYTGDFCPMEISVGYQHPLLHIKDWKASACSGSEKVENLTMALDQLQAAIISVKKFI